MRHNFAISRREAPEVCYELPALSNQRAQGMSGARCAGSRVCSVVSTRVSHHGHTGITRHSPRNGFNGCFVLPPSSLRSLLLKNLTSASGCQDHTTLPSASPRSRLWRRLRPPHPALTSVTIAKRPSLGAGRLEF